jgi:hypothetical protein
MSLETFPQTESKVRPLKIPFAKCNGSLIHISEVEGGLHEDCRCPLCNRSLVARRGSLKVHHFAHATESNCEPETVMHLLGKQLLAEKVEAAIREGLPLFLSWHCEDCDDSHEIDLTQNIAQVSVEHDLGTLRPDVVLLTHHNEPAMILELVVTHSPDERVLAYCTERKIPFFEFRLKKMGDLDALRGSQKLEATWTAFCPRPKCEKCGHPLQPRKLFVVSGTCWKCHSSMKVAFIDCEGYTLDPSQMTPDEIAKSNELGAFISDNYSRTMNKVSVSNTCPTCGLLTGNFHIQNFTEKAEGMAGIQTGLGCVRC